MLSIFMIAQVFSSSDLWGMSDEREIFSKKPGSYSDEELKEIARKAVNYQVFDEADARSKSKDPIPPVEYAITGSGFYSLYNFSKKETIKLSKFFLEEICSQNKQLRSNYLKTQKDVVDWLTKTIDISIATLENERKAQIMNSTNDIEEVLKRVKDRRDHKPIESPEVNRTPEEKRMHAMFRAGKYCIERFNTDLKKEESRSVNFDPAASADTWKPISVKLIDSAYTWLQARNYRFMYDYDPKGKEQLPRDIETLNKQEEIRPFINVNDKSLRYLHGELVEKINKKTPYLQEQFQRTTSLEEKMKDNKKRAKIVDNYLNVAPAEEAMEKIDTYTRASIDKAAWLVGNVHSLLSKKTDDLLMIRNENPGLRIQPSFIDRYYEQKQCSLSSQPSAPLYPAVENK